MFRYCFLFLLKQLFTVDSSSKNKPIFSPLNQLIMKLFKTFIILFFPVLMISILPAQAQSDNENQEDVLKSPEEMEAPGIVAYLSGTSVYLEKAVIAGIDFGQQIIKKGKEKVSMTMNFDPKSMAMRVDFAEQVKRVINPAQSGIGYGAIYIHTTPVGKVKHPPMYFDNAGYVYTSGGKEGYIKVNFQKMNKMMMGSAKGAVGGINGIMGVVGLPGIEIPSGPTTYYGMDVSPKRFPILEWVFVYKPQYFENDQFRKTTVPCKAGEDCTAYILKSGEDAGSYVLFDSSNRLREIHTRQNGFIIFSYQEVNVKLPPAKDMSSFF